MFVVFLIIVGHNCLFFFLSFLVSKITSNTEETKTIMTFIMLCSWCNRILPIQGTCCLDEKELKKIVTKLVEQFMNNRKETGSSVKVNLVFCNLWYQLIPSSLT